MTMTRSSGLPRWLVLLLAMVALAVLGPPALALVVGLLAVAVGLTAVALKVGVVVLFVAMVLALGRAIFGRREPAPLPVARPAVDTLASVEARFDAEEAARRAALDRELEAALRNAP
jgi:membrane protein implicated in regulation of membrane protease activity